MQKKERNEELEYIDDFENIEEPEESEDNREEFKKNQKRNIQKAADAGRKEENPIQRMQLLWQGNF